MRALGQQRVGLRGGAPAQLVLPRQVTEVQQRGGVGHAFHAQFDAPRMAWLSQIASLQRLVGQPMPLLGGSKRAASARRRGAAGRAGPPDSAARSTHDPLHLRQKLVPARGLLLGILGLGKAQLAFHAPTSAVATPAPQRETSKSAFLWASLSPRSRWRHRARPGFTNVAAVSRNCSRRGAAGFQFQGVGFGVQVGDGSH